MQGIIIGFWRKCLIRLGGCRIDTEFGATSVRFLFSCYLCDVRVTFSLSSARVAVPGKYVMCVCECVCEVVLLPFGPCINPA